MGLAALAVLIGLVVLVWSAGIFIGGATILAKKLRVPSFLIGLIILGLGSSAPEMVVSVMAALQGSPELALGNAYGSNIINIALVLGATAIISPIIIHKSIVKRELPILVLVTALAAWQLRDGLLSQTDGALLLGGLVVVLGIQIMLSLCENSLEHKNNESESDLVKNDVVIDTHYDSKDSKVQAATETSLANGMGSLFIGMFMLILSSQAIVWGAVELATLWGLSELIIGLTIVSIGTSLPELVASLAAARRGEHDMALGNIIGSNIFNTLGVVGLAALIAPITANPMILSRDILMIGVLTLLLFVLCIFAFLSKRRFGRASGIVLVLCFVGYTLWLMQTINL
ncbi:calcium/sodium antiporter [Psychrobacter frigidicola]|uniref:Calcium/sodium antiporter n=1 Tax=Psychrobacter frigidicola TaxID=45611 RepID=A0A5C7A0P6_9GAMM|nr:calcium/sodium antiporter [Psychrobacter frigidicola]TXD96938.1 calcium/sodium antiporter [Psychrobacter frigidicola]